MQTNFTTEIQYKKIAENIRETIVRNHLKAGTRLLSAKRLAQGRDFVFSQSCNAAHMPSDVFSRQENTEFVSIGTP